MRVIALGRLRTPDLEPRSSFFPFPEPWKLPFEFTSGQHGSRRDCTENSAVGILSRVGFNPVKSHCWMCWHRALVSALGRRRQADFPELKASLVYIVNFGTARAQA